MVERVWKVKMVTNRKSDVAREIASAAEKLQEFKKINPEEIWQFIYSQANLTRSLNESKHLRWNDRDGEDLYDYQYLHYAVCYAMECKKCCGRWTGVQTISK